MGYNKGGGGTPLFNNVPPPSQGLVPGLENGLAPGTSIGEVRYDYPEHAQAALQSLNGSWLGNSQITLSQHRLKNEQQTKLLVVGVPQGLSKQEMLEHFS